MIKRYCFIGLGNPRKKYEGTRHNVGFGWIDAVVKSLSKDLKDYGFSERFEAHWASHDIDGKEVHFLKPQTFMNLSGHSLQAWKKKYAGDSKLFVILDDLDLPLGRLRLRPSGGDGGHRGLRSIIECLRTQEVTRLRIGVGRNHEDASEYVLEKFKPEEKEVIKKVFDIAPSHFQILLNEEVEKAMNQINSWTHEA